MLNEVKMSSRQKILEEIHPLALIQEVQQRPALYSRNNAQIASPHHKLRMWADVAESLFPDWDLCSARIRDDRVAALMKKWRNLRDTFKRQIEIQKKIREGARIKKKPYVYFKHMSFLTPHMADDDEGSSSPASQNAVSDAGDPSWQPSSSKRSRIEEPSYCITNDFSEIDEDKHFLMSLIPSFRRMNEDERLTAKMEILKMGLLLTTILPEDRDEVYGVASLPRSSKYRIFLVLKRVRLYMLRNTDAVMEFHFFEKFVFAIYARKSNT